MSESKNASVQQLIGSFKVLAVGVALLGGLYFAAQAISNVLYPSNPPARFETYSSDRLGISLLYPKTWEPRETGEEEPAKSITFTKPADASPDQPKVWRGQMVVDIQEAATEELQVAEDEFFAQLEQSIETNLSPPETEVSGREYAALNHKEEIEVSGHRALKVAIDINNFDSTDGETGQAVLVFVFLNPSKQATLFYEGHSTDQAIFNDFDRVIDSLTITETS